MKLLSVGIPVIWLMIFSVAADIELEKTYDYESELNRILDMRIELLDQSYYGDENVEDELEEILAEPLLSRDLESIEENRDTDLERVTGFEILEFQLLSRDQGGVVIRTVIRWTEEDESADPEGCFEYTVILQHTSEGKVKMSGFYQEAEIFPPFLCKKKEIEK
ncbi:MAG: hypothetical protein IJC41_02420 [Firmicutes bacterium]|nr:hypothetical protein [Bacillota bacterium]